MTANTGFALLSGFAPEAVAGLPLAALLPDAAAGAAARVAAALIGDLARLGVRRGPGPTTAGNIGLAVVPDDAEARQHRVSAVDTALCRAKADGRIPARRGREGRGGAEPLAA